MESIVFPAGQHLQVSVCMRMLGSEGNPEIAILEDRTSCALAVAPHAAPRLPDGLCLLKTPSRADGTRVPVTKASQKRHQDPAADPRSVSRSASAPSSLQYARPISRAMVHRVPVREVFGFRIHVLSEMTLETAQMESWKSPESSQGCATGTFSCDAVRESPQEHPYGTRRQGSTPRA